DYKPEWRPPCVGAGDNSHGERQRRIKQWLTRTRIRTQRSRAIVRGHRDCARRLFLGTGESRWDSARQTKNTFNVEGLREQIYQVRLLNVITGGQQWDQVSGQGCRVA